MIAEPTSMQPSTKKSLIVILVLLVVLGLVLFIFKDKFSNPKQTSDRNIVSVRGQAVAGFPEALVPQAQGGTIDNSYAEDFQTVKLYVLNLNNDMTVQANLDYYSKFLKDNGYEITTSKAMPVKAGDVVELGAISAKTATTNVDLAVVFDVATKKSSVNITYRKPEEKSTFNFINKAYAEQVNCASHSYGTWPWGEGNSLYIDGIDVTPGLRSESYSPCSEIEGGGGGSSSSGPTACSIGVVGSFNTDSPTYRPNMYATNAFFRIWNSGGTYYQEDVLDQPSKGYTDLPKGFIYYLTVTGNFTNQVVNGYASDFYDFDNSGRVTNPKTATVANCSGGALNIAEIPYRSRPVIDAQ